VLAVAASWRSRLAGRRTDGKDRALRAVGLRVAASAGQHIPDKPLRPIRTATGLPVPEGQEIYTAQIWHAGAVPSRASSAVSRMAVCLLGDACDDGGAPGLGDSDDRVHFDGDTV